MIIVEGCDNTGKSTLIKRLCADLPQLIHPPIPTGPSDGETLFNRYAPILSLSAAEGKNIILDRITVISEWVYGQALRGKLALNSAQMHMLEQGIAFHQPLILHCWRPEPSIRASFDDREQLEGVKEKISLIQRLYHDRIEQLRSKYGLAVVVYNFEKGEVAYKLAKTAVEAYTN